MTMKRLQFGALLCLSLLTSASSAPSNDDEILGVRVDVASVVSSLRSSSSPAARVLREETSERERSTELEEPKTSDQDAMHEREEEFEEEKQEATNLVAACMLLGGIVFVMSLFYLVHFPDKDIQRHSWSVISSTLSIFVAVLVFQALRGVMEVCIVEPLAESASDGARVRISVFFTYLQYVLIFLILQGTLAHFAFTRVHVSDSNAEDDKAVTEHKMTKRLKAMCWGTLNAHMAGFAGIHCSTDLQQLEIFASSPLTSLIPICIFALFQAGLFRLSSRLKHRYGRNRPDDIKESISKWAEYAEEAENDAASLALSFPAVCVVRYAVFGVLPNADGMEPTVHAHPLLRMILLLGLGLAFALVAILLVLLSQSSGGEHSNMLEVQGVLEGDAHSLEASFQAQQSFAAYMTRWNHIIESALAMMFAWCLLFDTKYAVNGLIVQMVGPSDPNSCVVRVIIALTVSMGAFVAIFFLDKLQDMESTGERADRAIGIVITSLAILVGFSWEQSFDAGVEVIAELSANLGAMAHVMVKLCIAILVGVVMVPAWRKYILRKVLENEAELGTKRKSVNGNGTNH
eukprot:TRINITY_DN26613_c0_g4_i1.p1 TRINITY_DN26613_c0_g4~~TRINITY_DN26613_c0_g4_i1.p1  ORF type:complete len:575 (+),score=53.21 TRINITY_DN26613_c0_g4_i1:81-1805(+)